MAITNTTLASPTYNGNGSTTEFATGFQFISNGDIQVIVTSSSGVETIKTITTHYTVSGAGDPGGGTVTFLTAPASGEKVNIKSNVTIDQQTDYAEGGSFSANTHETALDKLTKISQQIKEITDRSVKLPIVNQDIDVEPANPLPSYILRVNSAADGLEWVSPTQASLVGSLSPTDGGFVVGNGTEFVVESGATARTSIGVGSIATQDAASVSISGGTITGITDLAVADGGTGASTASGARTNLGLVIGTDVQAYNATLTDLSTKFTPASASGPASLALGEDSDNGSNKITLSAPASLASDYTFTLPTSAGTSGYSLVTDGSGNTSWSLVSSGGGGTPGGSDTQVQYNSSGSFAGSSGFTFDGTGTVYVANGIELGAASDTTLTRASAGNIAVEGNLIYRAGGTDVPVADGGTGLSSTTAYAVLCGGTTSTGALQSVASVGTAGQVLTSNGAGALPTFQSGGSGSWVKISSTTASASSSVSFTGLSSTYISYVVVITNLVPTTNGTDLYLRTSADNGATYASSASDYKTAGFLTVDNTYVGISAVAGAQLIVGGMSGSYSLGNGTGMVANGVLYIHNPSASLRCHVTGHIASLNSSSYQMIDFVNGWRDAAAAVNAIQFFMSSGTIASGTFTLYGITA